MSTQTNNIVVLGGGYSGVMAALRLAGKTKRLATTITLVNKLDYFVERPRLHEQATGTILKKRPLEQMLRGTKAKFVQGWVTAIDPARQCVEIETTTGRQQLFYSHLVYALGSRVERSAIPGVDDYAFTLDPYGELTSDALKNRLHSFGQRSFRAVIVGGGATGVETATEIKSKYPQSDVSIVSQSQVGAFKNPVIQHHIIEALQEQSITIREQCRINRVEADGVVFNSGRIAADVIVWAGGFSAPSLAKTAGLRVNSQNQILVDPYLRSVSHPNIYAVGDSACTVEEPGAPMRMALFTALVSGAQAAENIIAQIKGKAPQPLSFAWYGQGIALGLRDAVGFPTYPADAAWGVVFRRKVAVNIRNFFVWYLGAVLELERRIPGFFFWNGRKRYVKQRQREQQPNYEHRSI